MSLSCSGSYIASLLLAGAADDDSDDDEDDDNNEDRFYCEAQYQTEAEVATEDDRSWLAY
jgi:hypothetical protein